MKKYMFTILLVVSVGIALPQMWKKIIESNGELFAKVEEILSPGSDGEVSGTDELSSSSEDGTVSESDGTATDLTNGTVSESDGTAGILPEEEVPGTDEAPALPTEEDASGTDETVDPLTKGDIPGTEEVPTSPGEGEVPGTDGSTVTPTEETAVEEKTFETVDLTYWEDALFIGDSRTVGLSEYADLGGADVFASSGMSVYKVFSAKIEMPGAGKQTLEEVLAAKQYGKIYIMMGINELGYNHESTVKKFEEMYDKIHELQPDAILFLGANLHVTEKKSASDKIYNNEAINRLNQAIMGMADNQTRFYVDVNEVFDDANGNLDASYTADDAHVLGKYYAQWADWLLTKGIN